MARVGVSETQVSESDSRARQWRCFSETLSGVQESGVRFLCSGHGARMQRFAASLKVRVSVCVCLSVCVCVDVWVCECLWGVFEFVCACALLR
jgi:hypothetical protein